MHNRYVWVFFISLCLLSINPAWTFPIDWSGVFGADTHTISQFCRSSGNETLSTTDRTGTQALDTTDCGATFQTYILRLNPQIIINDGVTLKGELTSGFARGGFAGSEGTQTQDGSGNNSFFFTTPAQRSALNINQMYMELYADTALVHIGRFAKHFGSGMIFDGGNDAWDRFFTVYDGIQAEMKIGNFSVTPHFAKISSYNDTNNSDRPSGDYDVREMGLTAKYDNKNQDLVVALLYAKRSSEGKNTFNVSNNSSGAGTFSRGSTAVTVIEPFISKKWKNLTVTLEGSLQSGDFGNVYSQSESSNLAAQAYVLDALYTLGPKWDLGLMAGQASGDDGESTKFEAAYLHPNFQVANLMFRYYYPGFNTDSRSVFNSNITNTRFFKLHGNYKTDKWTWKAAAVYASALETATSGQEAWHHTRGYKFTAQQDQADDYGYEFDIGFDYMWNPNVTISGYFGYWVVGDYYAFTNTSEELSLSNVHGGGLSATVEF